MLKIQQVLTLGAPLKEHLILLPHMKEMHRAFPQLPQWQEILPLPIMTIQMIHQLQLFLFQLMEPGEE